MHRLDTGMKAIIQTATERSFVTIQQAHAWLPDEGGDPAMGGAEGGDGGLDALAVSR